MTDDIDPDGRATDAGTTQPTSDAALLGELSALVDQVDPVPAPLLASVRELFALRHLEAQFDGTTDDVDLAAISYDSGVDEPELVLRSDGAPRLLTFESARVRVELQVEHRPAGARLLGQLDPRTRAEIAVHDPSGRITARTTADDAGRFEIDPVPGGAVRLLCRPDGAPATATEWAVLA